MRKVKSKRDFVRRFQTGEFGNKLATWQDLTDFCLNTNRKTRKLFHLRNRVAGGDTYYNLTRKQLVAKWKEVQAPASYYASEMCDHSKNLLQGEVMECLPGTGVGLYLFCSTAVGVPMRQALTDLESVQHYTGMMATQVLRKNLNDNSFRWLMYLLETYPGHVVEFTALSRQCGVLPGYNTLFWEVRSY